MNVILCEGSVGMAERGMRRWLPNTVGSLHSGENVSIGSQRSQVRQRLTIQLESNWHQTHQRLSQTSTKRFAYPRVKTFNSEVLPQAPSPLFDEGVSLDSLDPNFPSRLQKDEFASHCLSAAAQRHSLHLSIPQSLMYVI